MYNPYIWAVLIKFAPYSVNLYKIIVLRKSHKKFYTNAFNVTSQFHGEIPNDARGFNRF